MALWGAGFETALDSAEGALFYAAAMKIVLAYSGGLDTSVLLAWLKETYHGGGDRLLRRCGAGGGIARAG